MINSTAIACFSADTIASEIKEMDINPLVATDRGLFAVDARIRIEK